MSASLETILSISDIRVKAYHGWYATERKIGGMYTISVDVYSASKVTDDFSDIDVSVNYEQIYAEVIAVMKDEYKLIEECCKAIWSNLKPLSPLDTWKVTLVKEDVPIKFVGKTSFTIKG